MQEESAQEERKERETTEYVDEDQGQKAHRVMIGREGEGLAASGGPKSRMLLELCVSGRIKFCESVIISDMDGKNY